MAHSLGAITLFNCRGGKFHLQYPEYLCDSAFINQDSEDDGLEEPLCLIRYEREGYYINRSNESDPDYKVILHTIGGDSISLPISTEETINYTRLQERIDPDFGYRLAEGDEIYIRDTDKNLSSSYTFHMDI